jgi:hypothetical protein
MTIIGIVITRQQLARLCIIIIINIVVLGFFL